ncbi:MULTISPECIES: hypothetical protein [Ramlibacter]|uniref:Uncharacterized protein n=1 Tax=Ramlibacter aquaticus TaxID=2780094 RepID=A0ABR9SHU5_9BURK|nr:MULTISPECIES: hypothetical protein [Ramlibacter]MBE7941922.1 hypothetical protein [Ramlibacter aquaticus]
MQDARTEGQGAKAPPGQRVEGAARPAAVDRGAGWVTAIAVATVAAVGLGAAWYVPREAPPEAALPPLQLPAQPLPGPQSVVQAPPLQPAGAPPAARAAGAAPACADCGTVLRVVALRESGGGRARAFQMQLRMDDGSEQVLEQRGAMAPGSRVRVHNGRLQALAGPG